MSLHATHKADIITKFRRADGDTGSPEVQVALISARIAQLSSHFETHKKDHASRRGLLKLVGHRRSLLDYLKGRDVASYRRVIAELGLRK